MTRVFLLFALLCGSFFTEAAPLKIRSLQTSPHPGRALINAQELIQQMRTAGQQSQDLLVTSELFLTGYGLRDFYKRPQRMIEETNEALQAIAQASAETGVAVLVGHISENTGDGKDLYNSASLIAEGQVKDTIHKMLLPTYDVFEDYRYFEPSQEPFRLLELNGVKIAVMICEDWWIEDRKINNRKLYAADPLPEIEALNPDIGVSLSSSPGYIDKLPHRVRVHQDVAEKLRIPFLYVNEVATYDNVQTDGFSFALDASGKVLAFSPGFQEAQMDTVFETGQLSFNNQSSNPSTQQIFNPDQVLKEDFIIESQIAMLRNYGKRTGHDKAIIGISGGIDSAVSAAIAVKALGPENVFFFAMPGPYSSQESEQLAYQLASDLGVPETNVQTKSIVKPFRALMEVNPEFAGTVAEENLQSSLRANILLRQSNVIPGSFVMSNGNRAEMLTGYFTIGGDNEGGVNILMDLYKREVYAVARRFNERFDQKITQGIIDREPTAELAADQRDTDVLPPYDVLDQILEDYTEKGLAVDDLAIKYTAVLPERSQEDLLWVYRLIRRVNIAEFKRRQSGIGLQLRGDGLDMNSWRYLIMTDIDKELPSQDYVENLLRNAGVSLDGHSGASCSETIKSQK
ncbi:MAG: NAD(+) synthase [Pseudomonadota bacterium]